MSGPACFINVYKKKSIKLRQFILSIAWHILYLIFISRIQMADGAWAMTNSSREVYGKLVRLMCWTHTHRNYSKKLPIIRKVNKELVKSLDVDIQKI